jgi:hypothetical protein
MRAQNYRPKVHTGTPAKRRTVSSASNITTRSRSPRGRSESRGQGARVLWILMIIGGVIGSGFVMAQHSQINVHQFKQAEEKVKTQLDEMTNQQRFLALEKERAINTQESERIARQSGLMQPKLENASVQPSGAEPPAKPQLAKMPSTKLAAKATASSAIRQPGKPSGRETDKQIVRQGVKVASQTVSKPMGKPGIKPAVLPKQSAKQTVLKPTSRVVPSGKATRSGKNQPQLAQRQEGKKDRRR